MHFSSWKSHCIIVVIVVVSVIIITITLIISSSLSLLLSHIEFYVVRLQCIFCHTMYSYASWWLSHRRHTGAQESRLGFSGRTLQIKISGRSPVRSWSQGTKQDGEIPHRARRSASLPLFVSLISYPCQLVPCKPFSPFLANVNSCSCSLCRRASVCRLSVVCLSVTFVHPTQPIEIFGNVSAPCNMLVTWRHPGKMLRRSSQGNPSVGRLNQRVLEKCIDFGPLRGYISDTVQDRR